MVRRREIGGSCCPTSCWSSNSAGECLGRVFTIPPPTLGLHIGPIFCQLTLGPWALGTPSLCPYLPRSESFPFCCLCLGYDTLHSLGSLLFPRFLTNSLCQISSILNAKSEFLFSNLDPDRQNCHSFCTNEVNPLRWIKDQKYGESPGWLFLLTKVTTQTQGNEKRLKDWRNWVC